MLAKRYNGDPKVIDLPRVMRVPGFFHRKGEPFLTHIVEANEALPPYTADDIVPDHVKDSGRRAARTTSMMTPPAHCGGAMPPRWTTWQRGCRSYSPMPHGSQRSGTLPQAAGPQH